MWGGEHRPQFWKGHNMSQELTDREVEILTLIAEGLTNAEIAGALDCATNTIEAHKYRMFAKLGARNSAHAVALYGRHRP